MNTHPNSLKNLRAPWQKGQSGNPGGRPKSRKQRKPSVTTDGSRGARCAKEWLDDLIGDYGSWLRELKETEKRAEAGDPDAIDKMAAHYTSTAALSSCPEDRKRERELCEAALAPWRAAIATSPGGRVRRFEGYLEEEKRRSQEPNPCIVCRNLPGYPDSA